MSKNERSDVDYTSLAHVFPWPGRTVRRKRVRRKRTRPTYERQYDWRTYRDGELEFEFGEVRGIDDGIADLKERGVWDDIPTKPQARLEGLVLRLEHATDYDIDWSYATVYRDEDGTLRLPERFDGDGPLGRKVPQRFHKALAKWQRQHEGG
jgi:hypothetical protein